MDINAIMTLVTALVTFVCGLIAKNNPKFNNKLIPVQNLLIGMIVTAIDFAITKDFNTAIAFTGLFTGGVYDLGKNLMELLKKGE